MKTLQAIELILNDAHGQYIPQIFAEGYGELFKLTSSQVETLSDPNNEWYWDTWQSVLDNCTCEIDGRKFALYQDGDLYVYEIDACQFCERCGHAYIHADMVEGYACKHCA